MNDTDKNLMTQALSYLETYLEDIAYCLDHDQDVSGENNGEDKRYHAELENFIKTVKKEITT